MITRKEDSPIMYMAIEKVEALEPNKLELTGYVTFSDGTEQRATILCSITKIKRL